MVRHTISQSFRHEGTLLALEEIMDTTDWANVPNLEKAGYITPLNDMRPKRRAKEIEVLESS